jgi:hypothetical protein
MVEMGIISLKTYKKMTAKKVEVLDQPTFPARRRIILKRKPVA